MEIYYSSITDVGNVRPHNEDFLYAGKVNDEEHLFIVADGMGGHSSGEVASYKAVSLLVSAIRGDWPRESQLIISALRRTVLTINEFIYREGIKNQSQKGMGTTLSALYVRNERGYIAHVGDSRIYRLSDDKLEQLTDDHSLVGRLLKEGYISEEEAHNHPKRNVLYQSVGLKQKIDVQTVGPFPIREGDKFLLCSDGLISELHDIQIEDYLLRYPPQLAVSGLLNLAKNGAASDNITLIAVSTRPGDAPREDTHPDTSPDIPSTEILPIPGRSRKKLVILAVALAVLLAFIIYFAVLFLKKNETPPPLEPITSQPSAAAPAGTARPQPAIPQPMGVATDLDNFMKTDITSPKSSPAPTHSPNAKPRKKTAPQQPSSDLKKKSGENKKKKEEPKPQG